MSIENQVLKVTGEKIECLLMSENAIQLLSSECATADEFNAAWTKKLSLATKSEIAYKSIKSITKEEGEDHIVVKSGMVGEQHLTFQNADDLQSFYAFFQNEKGFVKTEETMPALKSAMPYVWGLVGTLAATGLGYYLSVADDAPQEGSTRSARRGRMVQWVVDTLGTTGILLLGFGISAYVAYMIWSRYKNPPMQTRLVPAV
jgi:hypothetical protein